MDNQKTKNKKKSRAVGLFFPSTRRAINSSRYMQSLDR